MTTQQQINDKQTVINDKTKFNLTFNNVWAIVVALIIAAGSWFNLSTRVDLLSQKVEMMLENQKELLIKYSSLEGRYGTQALQIKALEIEQGLK